VFAGQLLSALLFKFSVLDLLSQHFSIVAAFSAPAPALILIFAGGLGSPRSDYQMNRFTFGAKTMERQDALTWWQDYRLCAVILVVLTIAPAAAH
jgi:hypothetical protein